MQAPQSNGPSTWEIIKAVWPVEDRPEAFQKESWINTMTPDTVLALKRCWDDQQKKEDRGEETFRKDAALPTTQFKSGPDNCADLLHPAR